ncbi:MAG TPA: sulfite exporter TauE/SafE family protein [Phycisphaerae bacterium]|nr:sulfite exporter TauE/SafE family protein [Phycisphaerae bacterium]
MIAESLAITAGGFLGSAHCIGMCGGFACAVGAGRANFWPLFARQFVYNVGRVFTYAFLGALAGASGLYLSRFTLGPVNPQQAFSLVAGAIMIALGLATLRLIRLPHRWTAATSQLFAPLFAYFLNARGWFGYFLAGLANGFLPCGLVYAFLALAAAAQDGPRGAVIMTLFGLGTMPAMLAIGCGTRLLTQSVRLRIYRVAAVFVVALGSVTLYRGWPSADAACCHAPGSANVAADDQLPP